MSTDTNDARDERTLREEPLNTRERVHEVAAAGIERSKAGKNAAAWDMIQQIPTCLPPGSGASDVFDQVVAAYSDAYEAEVNHMVCGRETGDDAVAAASYDVFREKLRELQQLAAVDADETAGFQTGGEL